MSSLRITGGSTTSSRKLNQVRNSFYVYLPKRWCEAFSLTRDSEVRIQQLADGSLLVLPPNMDLRSSNELHVSLSDSPDRDVQSILTGAYIVGAAQVDVTFKGKMDLAGREQISSWIRKLPGYEVLEEDGAHIVVSDTSEKQMILPILKRQFSTTKFMLSTLVRAMSDGSLDEAARIAARDEDVDRHRYFVERMCHIALRDPGYARKIGIHVSDCIHFSMTAKKVERIADHVCGAASEYAAQKSVERPVVKSAEDVATVYGDTMDAFFALQSPQADSGTSIRGDERTFLVVQEASKLAHKIARQEMTKRTTSTGLALLLMHIERISSYCSDICEIAVNRMIGDRLSSASNTADQE